MTHIELENYVRTLEARVSELEKQKAQYASALLDALRKPVEPVQEGRKMCPHCGVKPNHFFHVRTCNANKKKNNGEKETPS
jgi:hypothetical protein